MNHSVESSKGVDCRERAFGLLGDMLLGWHSILIARFCPRAEIIVPTLGEISGSHGGEYEDDSLVGYCTV
jgi:hypothetical protein